MPFKENPHDPLAFLAAIFWSFLHAFYEWFSTTQLTEFIFDIPHKQEHHSIHTILQSLSSETLLRSTVIIATMMSANPPTPNTAAMSSSSTPSGDDDDGNGSRMSTFEVVHTPLPSDILCGKDKTCIKHKGSREFRRIIESYTLQYQQATSRQEKMEITKEIFDRLQSSRFLKYNEDREIWETLHSMAVRDKIGHALRFSNRKGAGKSLQNKVKSRRSSPIISPRYASPVPSSASISSSYGSTESSQSSSEEAFSDDGQSLLDMDVQENVFEKQPMQSAFSDLKSSFPRYQINLTEQSIQLPFISSNSKDEDLSWILRMPLMEMKSDGKVYFVS